MPRFVSVALILAFLVIGISASAFYLGIGLGAEPSNSSKDWADFGTYFGGVAGTLLSFLTVLFLIYGAQQQAKQIQSADHENQKRELFRYVNRAEDHVDHWLNRNLPTKASGHIEFGDIVSGLALPDVVNRSTYDKSMNRLLQLTCSYCVALGLYRANVDSHFAFQLHQDKASRLLEYLQAHQDSLPPLAIASIKFCKMHLEGKSAA